MEEHCDERSSIEYELALGNNRASSTQKGSGDWQECELTAFTIR